MSWIKNPPFEGGIKEVANSFQKVGQKRPRGFIRKNFHPKCLKNKAGREKIILNKKNETGERLARLACF
jgi:hypothetical protein